MKTITYELCLIQLHIEYLRNCIVTITTVEHDVDGVHVDIK